MRAIRTMLGGFGLLLATVCAALAVLAQGGRWSAQLDAITHIAPLLLAAAGLAALLSALHRGSPRKVGLGLSALAALSAASLIAPEYLRSTGPHAPRGAPGEIKVIQFNAWRDNRNIDGIVAWLKAENPDFAIIEEATPKLRNRIKLKTGWHVSGSLSDTMIFSHSRYLVMNRPDPPLNAPLTWVNATYDSRSGPLEAVVTHLAWPIDPDYEAKNAALAAVVSQLPRRRMVVAGDFNSTPWSFMLRRDDANLGLIRRDRGVATWPAGHAAEWPWAAPFPFLAIDHIYAGPGWATTSVRRGPRLGSDHYPLIVTLAPVAAP